MHVGLRLLPPIALLLGFGLLVLAVMSGGAHVFLLLIVPVVTGASLTFYLGTVLVVLGFLSLPLLASGEAAPPAPRHGAPPRAEGGWSDGAGGIVLLGPFPIFFGSWKSVSTRTRWLAALAGAILLAVGIYLGLVLSR